MNKYKTITIFDFPIFVSNLDEIHIGSNCVVVNTINQYSYIIAEKDKKFKQALVESDILLPDGIGIVSAVNFLTGIKIKKIAGADIHVQLLRELNEYGGKCFYLGSNERTLVNIKKRLASEYPSIKMGFYSPPFKAKFNEADNSIIMNKVNSFGPDVLFVGMTAPKQEKWVLEHKDQLDVKLICSIGAVFDFYAGTVNRPGQIWINLGLEWLIRLINDPKHMWKRYIYYGPVFVYKILKEKIKTF